MVFSEVTHSFPNNQLSRLISYTDGWICTLVLVFSVMYSSSIIKICSSLSNFSVNILCFCLWMFLFCFRIYWLQVFRYVFVDSRVWNACFYAQCIFRFLGLGVNSLNFRWNYLSISTFNCQIHDKKVVVTEEMIASKSLANILEYPGGFWSWILKSYL